MRGFLDLMEVMNGDVWDGQGFSDFWQSCRSDSGAWRVTHCPVLPGGSETAAGPGRNWDQSPHPLPSTAELMVKREQRQQPCLVIGAAAPLSRPRPAPPPQQLQNCGPAGGKKGVATNGPESQGTCRPRAFLGKILL